jgi:multidrug efflux pump subunit AcrA (membrane-fusion protein)
VSSLGSQGAGIGARPVAGPPSADPAAGTVDLYYAVSGAPSLLRVGQRVAVELPVSGRRENGVVVPTSALLNDIYGGEWVYVASGPREYHRKRVEISGIEDGRALVARGLASGDKVVTAGAAELFGTEFGAK